MTSRHALWLLVGLSTALRVAWSASLGTVSNESYYYLYARHLDWSYFDHPPMVALVGMLGLKLLGPAAPVMGLRAGFIALFAGSTWLMARLTARSFGPRAGFLAALALNVTGYFGLVVGTFAAPDGPLLFFWLLTLDRLTVALADPARRLPWLAVGLAWGGALLSKYHAVLLPAGFALYLILRPRMRRCLRTPGPYLAVAVGLVLFAPVIGWNAGHHWASFLFQGTRAPNAFRLRPDRLAESVGTGALFLFPWLWAALVAILVRLLRRGPRAWGEPEAFLGCQAVPALILFHGVAATRFIMPHWPLIGFVALMPLLGRAWAESLDARPGRMRRRLATLAAVPIVMAALVAAQAVSGTLQDGRGRLLGLVSPRDDPTAEPIAWDRIARELGRRGLLRAPGTFLFTESWRHSADLSFATRQETQVACYARDNRGFAFWSRPEDWIGLDGIYVSLDGDAPPAADFARWFARIEPIGAFNVLRRGAPVRAVHLYRCTRQIEAFPFGYTRPKPPFGIDLLDIRRP